MEVKGRMAVGVVNEMGETIGVVLHSDVLDMVFTQRATRSERLLNQQPLLPVGPDQWQATGMSNLRVLEQYFGVELPVTSSVTVAGVIQECLQRLPVVGDQCIWGPFEMAVTEAPNGHPITVRIRHIPAAEGEF